MEGTYILSCYDAKRWYTFANCWLHQGKTEQAIACYERSLKLQPNYIPGYYKLADLFKQQQRHSQSLTMYQRALDLGATEIWLPSHIETLIIERGDFADIDQRFEQCMASRLHRNHQGFTNRSTSGAEKSLLLYTNCPGTYGAEQVNHLLMCNLLKQGYRITCVQSFANHYLIDERKTLGIEHIWLKKDAHNFLYSLTNVLEVVQILELIQPDLIIFADGEPTANLAANHVAMRLGIPFIKVIHCVNAGWADRFSAYLPLLPDIYRAASTVISVSQANLQLLRDRYHLPEDIGQVVYNGRGKAYFAQRDQGAGLRIRQALGIPPSATVVLTTARLVTSKGHQHQLAAIKLLQKMPLWGSLYFVWAGSGPDESMLKAQVDELGISDYVKFVGERSDVCDLLDAADIFVLTSHFEGMPLSIMEAMAKEVPVAATSISGIPEALGKTGKLLPDPTINPEETAMCLADAIETWAANPSLRAKAAAACKQRALELFQGVNMLESYFSIIKKSLTED
ncbi:MAG: glycosyltransferase [Cyanobacteria bacterium J06627_32]